MSVARKVERFVVEEIAVGRGIESVSHDEDLLAADILDSLGIMELVSFLEEQYGIRVSDDDLTPENFQTVDSIVAFIDRKKG
jgi:acyl carrier protein